MSKVTNAVAAEAIAQFSAKIQEISRSSIPITNHQADSIASEVASSVTQSPSVRRAVAAATPQPVSFLKSQVMWGAFIAIAPNLVVFVARYFGYELAEGDAADLVSQLSALAGGLLAVYGRITTTRPIAGTKAAEEVARRAA